MESLLTLLFPVFILIAGLLIVTRFLVGRRVFEEAGGHWLYDISKTLLRIPFRILGYLFSRIARFVRLINRRL
jgi:hypothetical protein